MEINRQTIRVETNLDTNMREVKGIDDKIEVTDEIVAAVRHNPNLLGPVALALAHKKTEQQCSEDMDEFFGNTLIKHIINFETELRGELTGTIGTAQETSDTL